MSCRLPLLAPSLLLVLAACSAAPNDPQAPAPIDSGSPFADTDVDSGTAEAPAPLDSGTDSSTDTPIESPPACIPTAGEDDPDDDFKDSDCDGIDGSKLEAHARPPTPPENPGKSPRARRRGS